MSSQDVLVISVGVFTVCWELARIQLLPELA